MTEHKEYFNYLRQRSRLGLLYRKYLLYPRLSNLLKEKALDVGCGIGDLLAYRPDIMGIDINLKNVEWCQSQGLDAQVMKIDQIPFDDNQFNSIILDNVLEHIENPTPILTEVYRVLEKNGQLIVGVPGTLGFTKDSDHKVFYSKEYLVETVTSSGFNVQQVFAMPLNLKWLDSRMSQYCIYGVFRKNGSND